VRGVLKKWKTQTRRIISCRNTIVDGHSVGKEMWESFNFDFETGRVSDASLPGTRGLCLLVQGKERGWAYTLQPKVNVGDLLWVRETWQICHMFTDGETGYVDDVEIWKGKIPKEKPDLDECGCQWGDVAYDADMQESQHPPDDRFVERYRPGIHMPRWACRIELDVKDVRAERIQQITEEDSRAEGIIDGGCLNCGESEPCGCDNPNPDARDSFINLWDSINKKLGHGWDQNDWVWIYEWPPYEGGKI
ncbi:hypothetical protein LCGC14_2684060, partial [marine sediment metagenome]